MVYWDLIHDIYYENIKVVNHQFAWVILGIYFCTWDIFFENSFYIYYGEKLLLYLYIEFCQILKENKESNENQIMINIIFNWLIIYICLILLSDMILKYQINFLEYKLFFILIYYIV